LKLHEIIIATRRATIMTYFRAAGKSDLQDLRFVILFAINNTKRFNPLRNERKVRDVNIIHF